MKKIICMGLVCLMLCSNFGFCFATDKCKSINEEVALRYVVIDKVTSQLGFAGGNANYLVKLAPKSNAKISYVNATLKLVNSKGTVIKTITEKIYAVGGVFKLTDTKNAVARGTYHAEYTLRVYKGSSLVETIKGKSVAVTY